MPNKSLSNILSLVKFHQVSGHEVGTASIEKLFLFIKNSYIIFAFVRLLAM